MYQHFTRTIYCSLCRSLSCLTGLVLIVISAPALFAQQPTPTATPSAVIPPPVVPGTTRTITISDAVTIFLQQNLQLVAARYDVDMAEAEKLTAKLRPNPQIAISFADIPFNFRRNFVNPQTLTYSISQTLELGKKRLKRIDSANADANLAEAQFQIQVWQLTNDVKRKFYAVLLAESLLNLSKENQKTFDEVVTRTTDLFKSGEISGLDLQRLEVEKFKFDTDVANSERDYELALRDLRTALGGDYRTMNIEAAGTLDLYQLYDFTLADMRDKALAARPDLKASQLSEKSADAAIRLQDALKIPDLSVGAGIEQSTPVTDTTYNAGVAINIPLFDRNQGERAKALIQKQKAQNDQKIITNQIESDVDKAIIAFNIQKRRIELYRTGILTKVTDIQNLTEFSLKAGESSTLELLDAIRTRRETLADFYQSVFDYHMALLDLELATATPLP